MKHLLILTTLLLTFGITKAQEETVCMPVKVAKSIAVDLTNCDSLKEMYNLTIDQIMLMEQQSKFKDSALFNAKADVVNLTKQFANEHDQKQNYMIWYNRLKDDHDKLIVRDRHRKTRRTIMDIFGILILGAAGYFYQTK